MPDFHSDILVLPNFGASAVTRSAGFSPTVVSEYRWELRTVLDRDGWSVGELPPSGYAALGYAIWAGGTRRLVAREGFAILDYSRNPYLQRHWRADDPLARLGCGDWTWCGHGVWDRALPDLVWTRSGDG